MNFWRIVFAVAALFNFVVGGAILLQPEAIATLPFTGTAAESLLVQTAGWLIFVFGVGYAMVAASPMRYRGIAVLGVIGKAAVPFFAYRFFAAGQIPFENFALSLVDAVFVVLFAWFLFSARNDK